MSPLAKGDPFTLSCGRALERFQEKWPRFSVRKRDQTRNLEHFMSQLILERLWNIFYDIFTLRKRLPSYSAALIGAMSSGGISGIGSSAQPLLVRRAGQGMA